MGEKEIYMGWSEITFFFTSGQWAGNMEIKTSSDIINSVYVSSKTSTPFAKMTMIWTLQVLRLHRTWLVHEYKRQTWEKCLRVWNNRACKLQTMLNPLSFYKSIHVRCWEMIKRVWKKKLKPTDLYPSYHFEVVQIGQWGLNTEMWTAENLKV